MKKIFIIVGKPVLVAMAVCYLIAGALIASAQEGTANLVTVRLSRDASSPVISKLLLGSQYDYFSTPMRERLNDANLLKSWKEMPVTMLRYPGGTWADHYLWDKPTSSYYAVGNADTIIKPEQFLENCKAIGAEPIFEVNTSMLNGEGSYIQPGNLEDIRVGADRAARWVSEINKRKKWNVKYWEIGNEVWIWLKPEQYAMVLVEYSKAMKQIDPTIKIIACGLSSKVGPFKPTWLKFPNDPNWTCTEIVNEPEAWNRVLLTNAAGSFDYIAPHIYISGGSNKMSPEERFTKTNEVILEGKHLAAEVNALKNAGGKVKVAVTEWGSNFDQSIPVLKSTVPLTEQYYYTLGNGLNTGFLFGEMVRSTMAPEIAVQHSLDNFQTMWYWPKKELAAKGPLLHPIYYAMQIWSRHMGERWLKVNVENRPTVKVSHGEIPSIHLYGSEDNGHVYVVAINIDPTKECTVLIPRSDMTVGGPAQITWLKGKELSAQNFGAWNGQAPEQVLLTAETLQATKEGWKIVMPAHSMAGIKLAKPKKF